MQPDLRIGGGATSVPRYAWVIAAAMLLLLAICNGVTLAGLSVFDDTMLRITHASIGALKFRDLLGLICSGSAAPLIGWAADRVGVRPVIAFGLVLIAAALLAYAQIHALWQIYAIHILLGVAFAATNIVVVMVLLAQWFPARRGLALGVVLSGTSIGGAILPPIVAMLIGRLGWQDAFRTLALFPLLYLPVVFAVVRERRGEAVAPQAEHRPLIPPRLFSRELLPLVLVSAIVFYAANTYVRHAFLFLKLGGADLVTAAAGISTVFAFGLVGKIGSGFATEFVPLRTVLAVAEVATLLGTGLLLSAGLAHATLAFALIGLGWGGGYTLVQLAAARVLAGPGLGRKLGGFVAIESLAQGLGSFLSGVLHDIGASYTLPFALVAGLMAVALIVTLSTRAFQAPSRPAMAIA